MARDKSVVFVPAKGEYWLAPAGTAFPTDPDDPGAGAWVEIGHTSRDTPMQVSRDGGETTALGSWQDANLRSEVAAITYRIAFNLLQYDETGLKLYYGANAAVVSGRVRPPKSPVATESALFIRIIDGAKAQYRHYKRVSIIGADSEEFDVAQLASLPVAATILGDENDDYLGEISAPAPTGANEVQTITVTGTPTGGTFTLTYSGQTTANIVYNAAAAAVQSALEALSNLAVGDVVCAGGALPGTPVTATFQGDLAGVNVPQMTANSTGLTGGTSPTVTVTTTTEGGS